MFLSAYNGLPGFDQLLHGVHFMLCAFSVLIFCAGFLIARSTGEYRFGGALYIPISCAAFTVASWMAVREASLVLLCFNVFCAYLVLSGWRAMYEEQKPALIDWLIPSGLLALAVGVSLHAVLVDEGKRSFYLLFFAMNAVYLAARDFRQLRLRCKPQKPLPFSVVDETFAPHSPDWLNRHIAGMVGSMIANFSVVVLTLLPIELHWMWPAGLILCAGYMFVQQRRRKAAMRRAIPSIFQMPKPAYGVVRPRKDNDIRRAA